MKKVYTSRNSIVVKIGDRTSPIIQQALSKLERKGRVSVMGKYNTLNYLRTIRTKIKKQQSVKHRIFNHGNHLILEICKE